MLSWQIVEHGKPIGRAAELVFRPLPLGNVVAVRYHATSSS